MGCQPPVTRVRYKYSGDGSRDIHVEGGLRMGPLYDLVFGILYGGDLQHGDGRAVEIGWKPAVFGTQTTWPGGSPWALATRRVRRRPRVGVAHADVSSALNCGDDDDYDYGYDDEVEVIVRAVRKSRGRGGKYSRYNRYPEHMDDRADYLRTRSRTGSQWMF